jgi:hypothetical protein
VPGASATVALATAATTATATMGTKKGKPSKLSVELLSFFFTYGLKSFRKAQNFSQFFEVT